MRSDSGIAFVLQTTELLHQIDNGDLSAGTLHLLHVIGHLFHRSECALDSTLIRLHGVRDHDQFGSPQRFFVQQPIRHI